jgi:hypothetical protein
MDILAIKNEAEIAANLAQANFLQTHGNMAYTAVLTKYGFRTYIGARAD